MFTKRSLMRYITTQIAIVASAVLLASLIVYSTAKEIKHIQTSISTSKTLATTLTNRNSLLAHIMSEYSRYDIQKENIEKALLPAENILDFADALESLGAKHGIKPTMHFDVPVATGETFSIHKTPIAKVSFTLSINANIDTAIAYLEDLERVPYFATVNSVTLAAEKAGDWKQGGLVNIAGVLFTRLDNPTIP